jgi:MFS family permease
VLVATLLGVFVTSFPVVILVAALPDVAADMGVGESSAGWVLTAPMIAGAVLVPLFGKLGDLHGHRRVFLTGFAVAAVTAVLSALAWDLASLVFFRTVSQAAGTATSPTALAMLMASHSAADRPKALGAWSFAGASAPVAGLLAGGPFVGAVGWRGLFVLEAVVIFLALPYCWRVLPATARAAKVRFDVKGGALLALGSGCAVWAIDRSAHWGIASPGVLLPLVLCPFVLWAFVAVERRVEEPLLPLGLLRHRRYLAPVLGDALIQIPSMGAFFVAPIVLHLAFDRSVVESAYLLIPMPLGMAALAPVGGRLTASIGERRTASIGAVLMLASLAVCTTGFLSDRVAVLVLGFAMHGAAVGLNQPAVATAAAAALEPATTGVGMAVMRMITSLGSAAGISVAAASIGDERFGVTYAVLAVGGAAALLAARAVTTSDAPSEALVESPA